MRESVEHEYEQSRAGGALREGARIVVMSLIVTTVIASGYLMLNGRGGAAAQTTAPGASSGSTPSGSTPSGSTPSGSTPSGSTSSTDAQPTPAASVAPSFADKVAQAIAKLPSGSLTSTQKHTALAAYDKALGFDFGAGGSPATAATTACSLLAGTTKPADLVSGVQDGASLTDVQARAFLLGASTLYCPKYASDFTG